MVSPTEDIDFWPTHNASEDYQHSKISRTMWPYDKDPINRVYLASDGSKRCDYSKIYDVSAQQKMDWLNAAEMMPIEVMKSPYIFPHNFSGSDTCVELVLA